MGFCCFRLGLKLSLLVTRFLSKEPSTIDLPLLFSVLALVVFGVVMVYDASIALAHEQFGDQTYFLKNQITWAFFGLIFGSLALKIDYHRWQTLARPLFALALFFLILVLVPQFSRQTLGARRRLNLPFQFPVVGTVGFQPSELAKFSLVLYIASHLGKEEKDKMGKKRAEKNKLLRLLLLVGLAAGLVAVGPDLGTALVVAGVGLTVYFLSGASLIEMSIFALLGLLAALIFTFSAPYRIQRVSTYLGLLTDRQGVSYHLNQVQIALGSGGFFGLGLGASRQKYQYLPEVMTDSIFAVIGEELGFAGAAFTVLLLSFVILRGLQIVRHATDKFGRLLAGGLTSIVTIQVLLNLGSMVALIPLTGVPLPFISYGGSNLTLMLWGMGILLNISRNKIKT